MRFIKKRIRTILTKRTKGKIDMEEFLSEWYGLLAFLLFDLVAITLVISITYRWFFKRVFDWIVSAVCLIVTSPLFLTVYIRGARFKNKAEIDLSLITEKTVIGKKGKRVSLRSFRTKDDDGDELGYYGAWLKRTGLYKLPALLDVFMGRRSFVGVWAFTPVDATFVSDEDSARFIVRPGIINPLVLTGSETLTYDEMLSSDVNYAYGYSFFKDMKIFFGWLLYKLREGGKNYMGETKEIGYAESLLNAGKITKADYDTALQTEEESE